MINKFKLSNNKWKKKLFQFNKYIYDIFFTQPICQFIYSFTILGTTIKFQIFDYSDFYNSGPFNIHKKPKQFMQAIVGYAIISDKELGLDTFIEQNRGDLFIIIIENTTGDKKRF